MYVTRKVTRHAELYCSFCRPLSNVAFYSYRCERHEFPHICRQLSLFGYLCKASFSVPRGQSEPLTIVGVYDVHDLWAFPL